MNFSYVAGIGSTLESGLNDSESREKLTMITHIETHPCH